MTHVAKQLLGSAVPHAEQRTGALPAKILSNMFRFVNLTLRKRAEKAKVQSRGAKPAAATEQSPVLRPAARASAVHAPTFIRPPSRVGGGVGGFGGGIGTESREATEAAAAPARDAGAKPSAQSKSDAAAGGEAGEVAWTSQRPPSLVTRVVALAAGDPILTAAPQGAKGFVVPAPEEFKTAALGAANGVKSHAKKKGKDGEKIAKREVNSRIASVASSMARALDGHGCAVCDQFLSPGLVAEVRKEIARLEPHYKASEIWVGKDSDVGAQLTVPRVRGDKVLWVDSGSIAASKMGATQAMLESLDRLVYTELGSRCRRLGKLKERTDPMLAIYPGGGARFQKHVDNTARDGRRLTVLCYLNESWDAKADGGALRMHETKFVEQNKKKGGQQSAKEVGVAREVDPLGGRIALFWSDAIPHEVLPAHAHRHAVTIWYYDADERKEALETGKASATGATDGAGGGGGDEKAHLRSRHEARAFLLWILASDKTADQTAVEAIAQRALKLSPGAARIVAGVVGAPSPQDFMEALGRLKPEDLEKLRADLCDMGLANR
mmetsp:Transcript_33134/g.74830  ORF Transcript_33134/g.74830 Transcript_33134/m.74830 type:complete len:553 (-) Transcript_33134:483-2141(-)